MIGAHAASINDAFKEVYFVVSGWLGRICKHHYTPKSAHPTQPSGQVDRLPITIAGNSVSHGPVKLTHIDFVGLYA